MANFANAVSRADTLLRTTPTLPEHNDANTNVIRLNRVDLNPARTPAPCVARFKTHLSVNDDWRASMSRRLADSCCSSSSLDASRWCSRCLPNVASATQTR